MKIQGDELMTKLEVAQELKVSRWTVDRILRDGRLTYLKVGPSDKSPVRIRRSDFDAFKEKATYNKQLA